MTKDFYSAEDLIERLSHSATQEKKVIFLVGAAASTVKSTESGGVPDVAGVISLIRSEFSTKAHILKDFHAQLKSSKNSYQKAFQFLLGKRGQDSANTIIKKAVLSAYRGGSKPTGAVIPDNTCEQLEAEYADWHLSNSTLALGQIVTSYPGTFGKRILTSNFDPLIELGICAASGIFYRTVLSGDGNVSNTSGKGCNVVHFHGYWYGSDTLHTPSQLLQPRPKLANSLAHLIGNSTVVVIGYGGWDDVFVRAMIDVACNENYSPDIIWGFYDKDESKIEKLSADLLEKFEPGIARGRVLLYSGIDCHEFFPNLLKALDADVGRGVQVASESEVSGDEESAYGLVAGQPQSAFKRRKTDQLGIQTQLSDSPPRVDAWVGRQAELALLKSAKSPVIVISGIGGQGKSALAAMYLKFAIDELKGEFELWDWRDCKEQGDRLGTQLSLIVERLTVGNVVAGELEGQDIDTLTDVFFNVLGDRRCLFVFDNVDHYIDLEDGLPVSALELLLKKAASRPHSSRFLFTCRINIQISNPGILPVHLDGLSIEESRALFGLRGVVVDRNQAFIDESTDLTGGHPLWLNLIAVQVAGRLASLAQILGAVKRGKEAGNVHISDPLEAQGKIYLDPIWGSLKEHQRSILRTMAEIVKPEPADRIEKYVAEKMFPAQFSKHIKILIELNLIVVKPRDGATPILDLHPIVRKYIKGRFQRSEQAPYAKAIIIVLDGFISMYRAHLEKNPSYETLGYWTQKAELSVNQRDFGAAIEALHDIERYLIVNGYPEEFIRVSRSVFDSIDWGTEFQKGGSIDDVFDTFISVLVQFGEEDTVNRFLQLYESAIPGKSSQYVNLCNMRCYQYWYSKNYDKAIEWGAEGRKLKSSGADIRFSSDHNLALAQRDSGNVEEALVYFLSDSVISNVLDPKVLEEERHYSFYGNIGRCLQFLRRQSDALICYRKSAALLERDIIEPQQRLNKGYVRHWVGDVFRSQGKAKEAFICYRIARYIFSEVSPPRLLDVELALSEIEVENPGLSVQMEGVHEEDMEVEFKRWIQGKEIRFKG